MYGRLVAPGGLLLQEEWFGIPGGSFYVALLTWGGFLNGKVGHQEVVLSRVCYSGEGKVSLIRGFETPGDSICR